MRFIIWTDRVLDNVIKAVEEIEPDKDHPQQVEIKPFKRSKTREQLGYLWSVVLPTIQQHIEDSTGDHYSTEEIYAWMIEEYAPDSVVSIGGEAKRVKLTASRMKVNEMSAFIDMVIQHAAMHMGLAIPEANEDQDG